VVVDGAFGLPILAIHDSDFLNSGAGCGLDTERNAVAQVEYEHVSTDEIGHDTLCFEFVIACLLQPNLGRVQSVALVDVCYVHASPRRTVPLSVDISNCPHAFLLCYTHKYPGNYQFLCSIAPRSVRG